MGRLRRCDINGGETKPFPRHNAPVVYSRRVAKRGYLLVLAEREALAWVLRHSRMAFPARPRRREVMALKTGDDLFLLTTRGCFHNPTRDRTRVIGQATPLGPAVQLDEAYELHGRVFPLGCELRIDS